MTHPSQTTFFQLLIVLLGTILADQNLAAQEILEETDSIIWANYDPSSSTMIRGYPNGWETYHPTTGEKRYFRAKSKTYPCCGTVQYHSDRLFIHSLMDLEVYHVKKDSIARLDSSRHPRMNISSSYFYKGDTVYNYGGYGFWSVRNQIVWFDRSKNKWTPIRPLATKVMPPGSHLHSSILVGKDLYTFSGFTGNDKDPVTLMASENVWRFNFETLEWSNLGVLNSNLIARIPEYTSRSRGVILKNKIAVYPIDGSLYLIDPVKNKVEIFPINKFHSDILSNALIPLQTFYHDDQVYYYRKIADATKINSGGKFQLCRVPIEKFLGTSVATEKFYRATSNQKIFWWIIPAGLVILLLARKINTERPSKRIIIETGGLRFRGQFFALESECILFLHYLITQTGEITSNDTIEFLAEQYPDSTKAASTRNDLVKQINLAVSNLKGEHTDAIQMSDSTKDKRIKVFHIKREIFQTSTN